MGKEKTWQEIGKKTIDSILADVQTIGKKAMADAKKVYNDASKLLEEKYEEAVKVLDEVRESDFFKEMYAELKEAGKEGVEAAKEKCETLKSRYNDRLDKLVIENPVAAGCVDGWLNSMGGIPAKRSRSSRYMKGVGIGMTVGYGSCALLIKKGHIILGLTPVITRGAKYLNDYLTEKVQEARQS